MQSQHIFIKRRMMDENIKIDPKNIKAFIEDSKPLMESKDFGKWKGFDKIKEDEDGKPIYQMPYVDYSVEVGKFESSFQHNKLLVPFESSEISKYLDIVNDHNIDLSIYPVEELLKMLSMIIKGNNLVEGLILNYLESNGIQRILSALQKKL